MTTYQTLGGKSLSQLPQIPIITGTTAIVEGINIEWDNKNTNVTGTTNVLQVFQNNVWVDKTTVAANVTTGSITGLSVLEDYNVRVAVLEGSRYYPSRVSTVNIPYTSGETTITASGNFTIPQGTTLLEYVIVAGGGGGGGSISQSTAEGISGGGGAGGMLEGSINNPAAGVTGITIGAGGAGGNNTTPTNGSNGGNTIAFGLTAIGGGGGARSDLAARDGLAGGSGGGGSNGNTTSGGAATGGQGNTGKGGTVSPDSSGGGGGKGSGGGTGTAGGTGLANAITGTVYAAGGDGRTITPLGTSPAGAANTGNGGGGSTSQNYANYVGAAGGSGVVIVRCTNP